MDALLSVTPYTSAGSFIGHGSEANHTLDIKNRTNIN